MKEEKKKKTKSFLDMLIWWYDIVKWWFFPWNGLMAALSISSQLNSSTIGNTIYHAIDYTDWEWYNAKCSKVYIIRSIFTKCSLKNTWNCPLSIGLKVIWETNDFDCRAYIKILTSLTRWSCSSFLGLTAKLNVHSNWID